VEKVLDNAAEIAHVKPLSKMYVKIKHPANIFPLNSPRQLPHTSVPICHSQSHYPPLVQNTFSETPVGKLINKNLDVRSNVVLQKSDKYL
jgi:hypothetical protein